jgi:ABC-2 type transport system permease protein
VQNRLWFNEEDQSRYFLVPGLIVLVITLNGALLTTLVVAREWERGTFEALFVTPAQVSEILLSKVLPYFGLGIFGLTLCLLAAKILFGVPFRGSLWVLGGGSALPVGRSRSRASDFHNRESPIRGESDYSDCRVCPDPDAFGIHL